MDLDTVINILKREFSKRADEITNIDLLGGEPLSNFTIIPQICNWVWERMPQMQFFIRTNGTLLNDEMKEWFSHHSKKIGLGLSIDGDPKTNRFNRGVKDVDLAFFKKHWPDIPVKLTVFPKSVSTLYKSIIYLYGKGFNITGGLAQGVKWDDNACFSLNTQMQKLVDYYVTHTDKKPIEPLFSLNFEHAFKTTSSNTSCEKPCWEKTVVHTYDCDKEMLPCQMFSVIVQGRKNRSSILLEAKKVKQELTDKDCKNCYIRWSCINCMALNYQHYGSFDKNINKEYSCTAHKITAYWSASLLTLLAMHKQVNFTNIEKIEAIRKAISYIKLVDYGK